MSNPIYCEFCGDIMLIVAETITNWTFSEEEDDYVKTEEVLSYLLCNVCDHRLNMKEVEEEATEEQWKEVMGKLFDDYDGGSGSTFDTP